MESRSKRGIIVNPNDNTETNLDNYNNWNIIVENNSDLENLYQEADRVIELFNKFIS